MLIICLGHQRHVVTCLVGKFVITLVSMQLYTHREDVDLVNSQQLQALPAQAVRYVAQDSGPSMDLLKTACPVLLIARLLHASSAAPLSCG